MVAWHSSLMVAKRLEVIAGLNGPHSPPGAERFQSMMLRPQTPSGCDQVSYHITKISLQCKKEWELSHLGSPSLGIWPSPMETDWKKKVLCSTACVKTDPAPSGSAHPFKARDFSNNTVQKHQFFGAQLCLLSSSHIHT